MPREKKAQIIDSLQEAFSKSDVCILTDYRGLPTAELNSLRRKLRASGVDYKVVKNTLAQFAVERADMNKLAGLFQGPVAVAFGHGEVTESAKVLVEHIRTSKSAPGCGDPGDIARKRCINKPGDGWNTEPHRGSG